MMRGIRNTILTIPIMLLFVRGYGQMKIGNITIDEATANKYLLDCYKHPDTVKLRSAWDYGRCNMCPESNEQSMQREQAAKDFNENTIKMSIGVARDTVKWDKGIDTLYDVYYENGTHSKKYITFPREKGFSVHFIGCLVPRNPSEQDFIKWKIKHENLK